MQEIAAMVNPQIIEKWNNKGGYSSENLDLNCFGAVALYFGFVDTASWMSHLDMQEFVEKFMEEVSALESKENDVYALFDSMGLLHTAVFLGDKYWQKPGKWQAEFTNKESIDDSHINRQGIQITGTYARYYRLKTKNKG